MVINGLSVVVEEFNKVLLQSDFQDFISRRLESYVDLHSSMWATSVLVVIMPLVSLNP